MSTSSHTRRVGTIGVTFLGVTLLALGVGLSACSSDSNSSGAAVANDTGSTPGESVGLNGTGTITGQVVDGATRAPIADADITLVLNGAKYAVQSSGSPDPDLTGTFSFSDVPSGFHVLKIVAADYAVWQAAVLVNPSLDGTPHTENLGKIGLGKTFALNVVTTADGSPLGGVTVLAEPNGATPDCGFQTIYSSYPPYVAVAPFYPSDQETSVVTDSNGRGTFAALNQCLRYLLVALPHDGDGNGTYDHTATSAMYEGVTNSDRTIALALKPVRRDDAITIVGTNMDQHLRPAFLARNLSDTGPDPGSSLVIDGAGCVSSPYSFPCPVSPIVTPDYPSTGVPSTGSRSAFKFVFNYPVSASSATVTLLDDLVNPDADGDDAVDPGFPVKRTVTATVALDATGTILTVTPTAGFPKNETITVGPISAIVNGVTTTVNQDVYVEDDTASGLSSSTAITADNYADSVAIPYPYPPYGSSSVYLEFPEYVTGTYRVVSYTTSTGTVTVDSPTIQIAPSNYYSSQSYASGEMVYTDGTTVPSCSPCGTGAGVVFRVPVSVSSPSGYYPSPIALADGDKLRVEVDVRDAVGNRLSREFDLTVQ